MSLHTHFTTVTPLSKKIALFLFFLLPIIAFIFGREYEYLSVIKNGPIPTPTPKMKQENKLHIWKTYNSKIGKLRFDYPSSWTVDESTRDLDRLLLISPGGFEFHFSVGGVQGGPTRCTTDDCSKIENYSIKPIKVNANKTIYLVHGKYISQGVSLQPALKYMSVYASDNPRPEYPVVAGAGIWFDIHMKNNLISQEGRPLYVHFYGGYPNSSPMHELTPEEYFKLEDVRVVDQIISSITFQ